MDEIHSNSSFMKAFFTLTVCCSCLIFSMQAQDKTYVPNARQAIQKSRMQPSQYLDLTKDSVEDQSNSIKEASAPKPVNYQVQRPIAIDAPKRRGKKSGESDFMKLAANSKEQ